MFVKRLFAPRSTTTRKPRLGMCGAGRPSRFKAVTDKERLSEDDFNGMNSFGELNSDLDEVGSIGQRGSSSRQDVNEQKYGSDAEHHEHSSQQRFGQDSREMKPSSALYSPHRQIASKQSSLCLPEHQGLQNSHQHHMMHYSNPGTAQQQQQQQSMPPQQPNTVITSYQQSQVPQAQQNAPMYMHAPVATADGKMINPQRMTQYEYQSQQMQMMHEPNMVNQQRLYTQGMPQPPLAPNAQQQHYQQAAMVPQKVPQNRTYSGDQPLPIVEIDMPNMEAYRQQQLHCDPINVSANPQQDALNQPKVVYKLNPITVKEQQAFAKLPYDMQAAVIQSMDNSQHQTVLNPNSINQARMNPHVHAVLNAQAAQRSAESLKAMAAQAGNNPVLADIQRQLQEKQMQEALRRYKEQNPNAPVQLPPQYQHLEQQYQCAPYSKMMNHPPGVQYQQQLQPTDQFPSQHAQDNYQQINDQSMYSLVDQCDDGGNEEGSLDGCNISRVPLKVFSVSTRRIKSPKDGAAGHEQNSVFQRDIVLYKLLEDPELLEIEAFLTVEECSHVIGLTNRVAANATEKKHELATILHLPESDAFVNTLKMRASRCLSERLEKTSNPVVYRFDASPKQALNSSDSFPSLDDEGQSVRTLLVYLNGDVEGGEIEMPNLGIAILPKQGYALSWRSIGPDGQYDYKTYHQNLPVIRGTLYCLTFYVRP